MSLVSAPVGPARLPLLTKYPLSLFLAPHDAFLANSALPGRLFLRPSSPDPRSNRARRQRLDQEEGRDPARDQERQLAPAATEKGRRGRGGPRCGAGRLLWWRSGEALGIACADLWMELVRLCESALPKPIGEAACEQRSLELRAVDYDRDDICIRVPLYRYCCSSSSCKAA